MSIIVFRNIFLRYFPDAISRQYMIPVLLPAAGTLSMSMIVFKNIFAGTLSIIVFRNIFFTGEGAAPPRTPAPHCYN